MLPETVDKEHYLAAFSKFGANGAARGPAWIRELRQAAIAKFAELGFPTTRNEEWKYTSVDPVAKVPFKMGKPVGLDLSVDELCRISMTDSSHPRVVFVNGHHVPELSSLQSLPQRARVGNLAQFFDADGGALEPYLGRCAAYQDQAFVALNTAFMEDGAYVEIPEGLVIEEPICLIFLSTLQKDPVVSHPRNLIIFGRGSQAKIVESYIGLKDQLYFTNAVTEILVGENASAEHYKLQQESHAAFHIATVQAALHRSSHFTSHAIALGGALVRNDLNVTLEGEGSECLLNGLFLAGDRQHVDNHTQIDHVKPHCASRELYKGVLSGKARGVFNGKVIVHKAAQKSDAKQTNKNLLLSENAVINTKPQLEIHADDVKCTHGSTIGQLDPDAIFYLRSRGLDLESARSLLTYAFASEMIGQIQVSPMRERLDDFMLTELETT